MTRDQLRALILTGIRTADDIVCDVFDRLGGPIRIVFVVSNLHGLDCQRPVIEKLLQVKGVRLSLVVHPAQRGWSPVESMSSQLRELMIPEATAVWKKWHYIFHTELTSIWFKRNAIHVMQSHGSAWGNNDYHKNVFINPLIRFCFLLGRSCYEDFTAEEKAKIASYSSLCFPIGQPKLDALISGRLDKGEMLSRLGLDPDKKTILIVSHWTKYSLLRNFGPTLVKKAARHFKDCNIIQTGHNTLWSAEHDDYFHSNVKYRGAEKLWAELKQVESAHSQVRVVRLIDTFQLLNAADLLITDQSSVMVEFAYLNRPILFYDNPEYQFTSPLIYDIYKGASQPFCDLDGLEAKIRAGFADPACEAVGRKKMTDFFLENKGCAADKAVDMVMSVGKLYGPRSPRWRVAEKLSKDMLSAV